MSGNMLGADEAAVNEAPMSPVFAELTRWGRYHGSSNTGQECS